MTALIHFFSNSENTSFEYWEGISKKEVLDWLKKQDQQEEPQVYEIEDGKVIIYSESEGYKVIEPKFKVGDWVVYNRDDYSREIIQVYDIRDGRYYFTDNVHFSWSIKECDEKSHLWSIKDAKEGDVLAADIIESYPSPFVAICKKQYGELFETYCFIGHDGKFYKGEIGHNGEYVHPATKEQRDMLFQKMHEAEYTFDFKKKELKKLKFKVGDEVITENEKSLTITKIDDEGYWSNDLFVCGFNTEHIWNLVEQKPAWSEEDEEHLNSIISDIKTDMGAYPRSQEVIDIYNDDISFLKSLKDRVQPQSQWKPSDDQMHSLKQAIDSYTFEPDYLEELYEDLKELKGE